MNRTCLVLLCATFGCASATPNPSSSRSPASATSKAATSNAATPSSEGGVAETAPDATSGALLGHPSPKPDEIARLPLPPGALKAHLRSGSYIVMRVQEPDKQPYLLKTVFAEVDDEGCDMVDTRIELVTKRQLDTKKHRATWLELESHAHFPKYNTVITAEKLDTRLGTLDTLKYEVRYGVKLIQMWFAPSLPGPPVRFETSVEGAQTYRMDMVETNRP